MHSHESANTPPATHLPQFRKVPSHRCDMPLAIKQSHVLKQLLLPAYRYRRPKLLLKPSLFMRDPHQGVERQAR